MSLTDAIKLVEENPKKYAVGMKDGKLILVINKDESLEGLGIFYDYQDN